MTFSKRHFYSLALALLAFCAGYYAGLLTVEEGVALDHLQRDQEMRLDSGRFTRPILDCEVDAHGSQRKKLISLHLRTQKFVDELQSRDGITKISIYFRDLDNGPWVGINEKDNYISASLHKVPLCVAIMRQAEDQPGLLDKKIRFDGLPDKRLGMYHFPPKENLEVGKEYTVWNLIERTLSYSDNASAWLLDQFVEKKYYDKVFHDLGIAYSREERKGLILSAEEFGRFFRCLYNGSYLSHADSEKLLEVMNRSTFADGLRAGLPDTTQLVHKFGEMSRGDGVNFALQFHDCGIVYNPSLPYMLCIMTLGHDYDAQIKAIADLTAFIDNEVTTQLSSKN